MQYLLFQGTNHLFPENFQSSTKSLFRDHETYNPYL